MSVDWESKYNETKTELEKTRREAAGYRSGNKGVLAEVARAMGLDPASSDFDTSKVSGAVTDKQQEIRDLKIGKALAETLHRKGVAYESAKLARAVLSDAGVLRNLDPNAADFQEALETHVSEVMEEHPQLRGTRATTAGRSGPDFSTSGVRNDQLTREELAGMTADQIVEARKAGKLRGVLRGEL